MMAVVGVLGRHMDSKLEVDCLAGAGVIAGHLYLSQEAMAMVTESQLNTLKTFVRLTKTLEKLTNAF